jgi:hypothetical protein
MRDAVAVDQRLRDAAGSSLRYSRTPAHVARQQVRAELLAEAAGGPVATETDTLGALVIADLATLPSTVDVHSLWNWPL